MRRVDTGPRPIASHLRPSDGTFARRRGLPGDTFIRPQRGGDRRGVARIVFLLLAVIAACWPLLAPGRGSSAPATTALEWPHELDGRPLRPQALGPVEQRFAARFPGAIGRFDDGRRVVILRHVAAPTRMLHPATDCFRGLGYRIADERLERTADATLQRCFVAERAGTRLRVCETIRDADGRVYTDASSWFWAAALARSRGPWLATTSAEVT
jgi:hypothetical protein